MKDLQGIERDLEEVNAKTRALERYRTELAEKQENLKTLEIQTGVSFHYSVFCSFRLTLYHFKANGPSTSKRARQAAASTTTPRGKARDFKTET